MAQETLSMWWFKALLPVLTTIVSASLVWVFMTERQLSVMTSDIKHLQVSIQDASVTSKEYLDVFQKISEGVNANQRAIELNQSAILKLEGKITGIIERNNKLMDTLLLRSQDNT